MGTVYRIGKLRIVVYAGDHAPPHFHIQGPGYALAVAIESMEIIAGSPQARGYDEAMRWAVENRAAIRAAWERLNGE
jgi:hypothetical protein